MGVPTIVDHSTTLIGPGPLQRGRVRRNEADGGILPEPIEGGGLSEAYRIAILDLGWKIMGGLIRGYHWLGVMRWEMGGAVKLI